MNIWQIIGRLVPFVKPYKFLVIVSLFLTLIGAVAAQVNPIVLRYTVDTIEQLVERRQSTRTESYVAFAVYQRDFVRQGTGQYRRQIRAKYARRTHPHQSFEPACRNTPSKKFSPTNTHIFADDENATGKLQTRIDRGAESLTRFVQRHFYRFAAAVRQRHFGARRDVQRQFLCRFGRFDYYADLFFSELAAGRIAKRRAARAAGFARNENERAFQHYRINHRHQILRPRRIRARKTSRSCSKI